MFMNKISVSQTRLYNIFYKKLPDFLQQPVATESIPQFTYVVANRMLYTTILSVTSLQAYTKREFLGCHSLFVSLLGTCFSSIH